MPKTLEELKEENKKAEGQKETLDKESGEKELEEGTLEEEIPPEGEKAEEELEKEGDDSEKDKELEPWMDPEDPVKKQDGKDFVPVGSHVEMKQKLRGRLSEKDEELEKLKAENLRLKTGQSEGAPQQTVPKTRPNPDDYTSQEEFDKALSDFKDWDTNDRMRRMRMKEEQEERQRKAKTEVDKSVDQHYDRAATLLTKSGIAPELFKNTDQKVRKTVETLMPGMGDVVTDGLISTLGEGSEKVMYYLGVNETALNKFQSLLVSDPTGLKAAVYLGQEKQRLTIQAKNQSHAPAPAKHAKGDQPKGSERGLKRKYDAAHKKGDLQAAYNLKQQAKKAGAKTSDW